MKPPPTRALRRHHNERLKRKRRYYHGASGWLEGVILAVRGRSLGLVLATPARCSCPFCKNPRRLSGEKTVFERAHFQMHNLYAFATPDTADGAGEC